MNLFDAIVEQRIAEAIEAGAFDDLPGAGRPLELDDDRLVPEELRAAFRILRNAGFLPPEVERRREVAGLRELVRAATADGDDEAARRARAKLALLEAAMEARGESLRACGDYRARIVERLSGR
jgi:hypothetical protein